MRHGYTMTTLRLNSKACSGSILVFQAPKVQGTGIGWQDNVYFFWDAEDVLLIGYMPHKVAVTGVYHTDLLHTNFMLQLNRSAEKSWPRYRYSCMAMHLLTGHMLDKPLYLNAGLKKCAIHHILFIWQQVITICCQIERNMSVVRDFWTVRSSSMRPTIG